LNIDLSIKKKLRKIPVIDRIVKSVFIFQTSEILFCNFLLVTQNKIIVGIEKNNPKQIVTVKTGKIEFSEEKFSFFIIGNIIQKIIGDKKVVINQT
jgi:hypothetical protein